MTNPCTLYGDSAIKRQCQSWHVSWKTKDFRRSFKHQRVAENPYQVKLCGCYRTTAFFFFFNFSSKYENVLFQKHSNWQNRTVTTHIHTTRVQPLTLHSVPSCSYPSIHLGHLVATQSYPTLCNPMDYSLAGSSVGILQARSHSLLQRIFLIQESNPGLWGWCKN